MRRAIALLLILGAGLALGQTAVISPTSPLGSRSGLKLSWVDADTIAISAGGCVTTNGTVLQYQGGSATFAALDAGSRTLGVDYAVFLTTEGIKLTAIATYHASGLIPSGHTAKNSCLLGYFHNGKAIGNNPATGAIFQYSITSNDQLDRARPYRALPYLPAGVPLPGMVRVGNLAIGIYKASREDATDSSGGTSTYPVSRYGVVPWASIGGWDAMQVAGQSGCRLPTWAEWLAAATFNPGSVSGARMNGNTYYGSASDDVYLSAPGAPTVALAGIGAGNMSVGAYKYKIAFVNANGETQGGTESAAVSVIDAAANGQIALSAIPTGGVGTTARKIYRTVSGGSTHKLVATIPDNTTTAYTDNVADASLGANVVNYNTTGAQKGTPDPTNLAGRTLTGTGPRTALNGSTVAGRSWYSPSGMADPVGNVWEWVGQFFGGLKTSSPGSGVAWGWEGDYAYNFQGQSYNPDTGGWTEGLPSMLHVGGDWSYGSSAGVRAAVAYYSPGHSYSNVGFRLAR